MKKLGIALSLTALAGVAPAQAQSQVTIYGSIDAGLEHVSNAAGTSQTGISSGKRSPDRFGFRGSEDLGDGLAANFRLESGFNAATGTTTNATAFWNRNASVSLEQRGVGSVSMGHIPDYMYELLPAHSNGVPGISGAFSPGNFDNLANRMQIDSAVKLQSAEFGGFSAGVMYGAESTNGVPKSRSAGLRYNGEALRVSAAYAYYANRTVNLRGPFGLGSFLGTTLPANGNFVAADYRGMGLGASYTVGLFTPHVLVTDVSLGNANGKSSVRNTYAGVIVDVSGGAKIDLVHVSVSRTKLLDRSMDQFNLFASHQLSKLTQVYAAWSTQHASNTTAGIFGYTPSSDDRQSLARVGLHKLF